MGALSSVDARSVSPVTHYENSSYQSKFELYVYDLTWPLESNVTTRSRVLIAETCSAGKSRPMVAHPPCKPASASAVRAAAAVRKARGEWVSVMASDRSEGARAGSTRREPRGASLDATARNG